MLSYRHAFHAGNFADVFKHVVLMQLIHALRRKDKPFYLHDTTPAPAVTTWRSAPARKNGNRRWDRPVVDQTALGPELASIWIECGR